MFTLKHVLLSIVGLLLILVVLEIVALLHEKASVASFANYWTQQNKTSTGSFTYVALGDSTAQGIGASQATNSYVGILADRIAHKTGKKVRCINLSVTGARLHDVLSKQLPELQQYKPDLVTIEIGANDVTQYNPKQFNAQFKQVISQLPANTYVSDMPYFGGRIRKNAEALAANQLIYSALKGSTMQLVYLQKITSDRNSYNSYAADLFHPSNHGYVNWADAFWQVIDPNLRAD
jgi:acyl-CoA thioesterase-1